MDNDSVSEEEIKEKKEPEFTMKPVEELFK